MALSPPVNQTASGSLAVGANARVALASRIYVEGRHDAELVEQVEHALRHFRAHLDARIKCRGIGGDNDAGNQGHVQTGRLIAEPQEHLGIEK